MARTTMTTSDNLRKEAWEEVLYRDTAKESYFMSRFGGEGLSKLEKGMGMNTTPNDVIHIKTNLEAKGATKNRKGDIITFGLVPRIDPATYPGVTSGQTLKGKEVPLSWYDFDLTLARYRQAISAGQPMDWHRASFSIPEEARTALKNWGVEKIDLLCFTALGTSPTKIFYKTSSGVTSTTTAATAKTALTAADSKITPAMVSWIKTWAMTGGARTQIPIRPIRVNGKNYYVLLTHPDCIYDWTQDSTVQQAYREAQERGNENPLFNGASYIWDNVVIHAHENIAVAADAGSGTDVPWAKSFLLGAQALCWAWGERPSIVEDTEDYQEDLFNAWRMTATVEKPVFNSIDYGSVCIYLSRSNVSGS